MGHAGLLQALAMLLVAYFILALTVLSVCAIATNGAVRGGGAYCILQQWWTGVWALLSYREEVGAPPCTRGRAGQGGGGVQVLTNVWQTGCYGEGDQHGLTG